MYEAESSTGDGASIGVESVSDIDSSSESKLYGPGIPQAGCGNTF